MGIKNILRSKGGWIGFVVAIAVIILSAKYEIPILTQLIKTISRAIVGFLCPGGGLECIAYGIPVLIFYGIIGFAVGYWLNRKV